MKVYQRTGLPIHPMGPFYKLLWLKNDHPELFEKAAFWVGIKEYIIWRYTNVLAEETSMAAATGLLNMHSIDWDPEILKLLDIKRSQLPELVEPTHSIVGIRSEYAKVDGISDNVRMVMGAT
ncbi:hypothetical protein L0P10_16020, partial [Eggerthella lenta]|nr:hypothetical protein [Eggerthella lenta]